MDFSGKRVYIAPHTPKTTAFAKEFRKSYDVDFAGFIDKVKSGEDISRLEDIKGEFDYILILSQNHFDAIYAEHKKSVALDKLIKVAIANGRYRYLDKKQIAKQQRKGFITVLKRRFLKVTAALLDHVGYKRNMRVFISKGFVGSNNKALFLHCHRSGADAVMLTDNKAHLAALRRNGFPAVWLGSWRSYFYMALADCIVQDQGNFIRELALLAPGQKTIQLWHGIPLKRMNRLVGVTYDVLVSPSDFVNETSLGAVIGAKSYKNFGYPRNDLLLKKKLERGDELLCDEQVYPRIKALREEGRSIAVYMPTHRESTQSAKIPLDFAVLNEALRRANTHLVVKLHPFVMQLYAKAEHGSYSHILFHNAQGDIYPLLRYCDVLITDYSSIYFDFMLLHRPVIFFDYDRDEYEGNMGGFVYPYEEFAPGVKVQTQKDLEQALAQAVGEDASVPAVPERCFDYRDAKASQRICREVLGV